MADPARGLLRWLAAHDPIEQLILTCPDVPMPKAPRGAVVVCGDRCLRDTNLGLAAQVLVSGVDVVAVMPCAEARDTTATWQESLRDVVEFEPPPRGRHPKEVLTLGQIAMPRRAVLGLRVQSALDLSLDDAARSLIAFRMLQEEDRASLPTPPAQNPAADTEASPSNSTDDESAGPPAVAAGLNVSGCTACGVCVLACPHDALRLEHDGETSTLSHLRESCRSEHQCIDLCPVDAITTAGPLSIAQVLDAPRHTLTEVTTKSCERCGTRHPLDDGPLCPACSFRTKNVFGSSLPPGIAEKIAAARRRRETT